MVDTIEVATPTYLSCAELSTRELNALLHEMTDGSRVVITEPRGRHNLGVGISKSLDITIAGNAGYFTGGLCEGPSLVVDGFVGWSVGENLMSGTIRVRGNASESAGASAHGGVVIIEGDASSRAAISLKGGTVAVGGDVGHMSAFMAQAGILLVGGDAGDSLGDSLYEAVIYVAGKVRSLGADAQFEDLTDADVAVVTDLVSLTGFDHIKPGDVTKIASARQLYNFDALKDQRY
ncbi:MAG: GltB/FmdC/FwdC-like GXGXG domain-containing protein [Acidimicrobiales bacterium]